MIGASLRRGLAAGALAGLLAGLLGLVVGEPAIDSAVAIEEQAAAADPAEEAVVAEFEITRPTQKVGLVAGSALLGLGVGAIFGVLAAWAAGRVRGDAWQRSVKLGLVLVGALVLLPWVKYPPNPPAVGDSATVGTRGALYLGLMVAGLLLAAAAYTAGLRLVAAGWPAPRRQATVGLGVVVVVALLLWLLPATAGAGDFPADLLWSFRLGALAVQATLVGVLAVVHGLLSSRAQQVAPLMTSA